MRGGVHAELFEESAGGRPLIQWLPAGDVDVNQRVREAWQDRPDVIAWAVPRQGGGVD